MAGTLRRMAKIKRLPLALLLFFVSASFIGLFPVSSASAATPLTAAQQQECFDKYNGKSIDTLRENDPNIDPKCFENNNCTSTNPIRCTNPNPSPADAAAAQKKM